MLKYVTVCFSKQHVYTLQGYSSFLIDLNLNRKSLRFYI